MCNDEVDVLALTETFFNGRSVNIEGYRCVVHDDRKDTEGGAWGGAAIYVKEDLVESIKVLPISKPTKTDGIPFKAQLCAVEIAGRTIAVLYRPPSQGDDYKMMPKLIADNFAKAKNCILLGDFNMPNCNWELNTGPCLRDTSK